jgi:hypothetical protein
VTITLTQVGAHQTEVTLGAVTLFFSYNTLVGALIPGRGAVVSDKFYSRTTSKHLTLWTQGRTVTTVPQGTLEALCTLRPE